MKRGPGWPTVLGLTLVVIASSVIHPLQLMLVPLALLLVALPPREPRLLVFAAVLAAMAFLGPRGPMWSVERGWALLLSSWFVVAVLVWPGRPFLIRATAATAATVASGAALIAAFGSWASLDWTIASEYRQMTETLARSWADALGSENVVELAVGLASLQAHLFPSLLAVASVAALGVAWWGYSRLARRGRALGRLTEFRFPDGMLWVLIGGLALLVVPLGLGDWVPRLGSNLVLFMSALYTLRGLAVVTALVLATVGTEIPVLVALALIGILLYPIVAAGTLLLGVTDTWLDLRSGHATNEEG